MLQQFAYAYTYTTTTTTTNPHVAAWLIPLAIIIFILAIVSLVGLAKVLRKAGRPAWVAIVPFYNTWVIAEISGKPGWWGLYPLLGLIPAVGSFASLIVAIAIAIALAKSFGKSVVFGIFGLGLFSFIGYIVLGFGNAKYLGPNGEGAVLATPTGSVGYTPVVQPPVAPTEAPQPPVEPVNPPDQTPPVNPVS